MDNINLNPGQLEEWQYQKFKSVNHNLDDADLEARCPLDNGRHAISARQHVGQFEKLPLELVPAIFLSLDIPSLTAFRQVNQRAMNLIDSLHQYTMGFEHCPDVLRAIIFLDARSFDLNTLFGTQQKSGERCTGNDIILN